MALTIAVCIGGFSVIYAALDDTFGDFLSREVEAPETPTAVPTEETVAANPNTGNSGNESESGEPEPTDEPVATEEPDATELTDEFVPDYQTSSEYSIRLRSEPSREGGDETIITTLPPETLLQFTGTDEPTTDPEDGDRWMLFRTEDGEEGWIREIDVNEYEP